MSATHLHGSASLDHSDYWWYRARTDLLEVALGRFVARPARILDVGSADGPSVGWLQGRQRVQIDVDPRGLTPGGGVLGSALSLPFADRTFDVVSAFDVLEHCEPEQRAIGELARVLDVGGRLLLSVPAYEWAWTDHDVRAGHHRRYTRRRLLETVEGTGLSVQRCTYAFGSVFPLFAAERLVRRMRRTKPSDNALPSVSATTDRLLMALCGIDRWVLRRTDLPFGSSVLLAAVKTR